MPPMKKKIRIQGKSHGADSTSQPFSSMGKSFHHVAIVRIFSLSWVSSPTNLQGVETHHRSYFSFPPSREIVGWTMFFECGFNLPSSDFFHLVLDFYGITLNHLKPNLFAHLSIFVHCCKAFLGIHTSLNLFRYIFCLKAQPYNDASAVVGRVGFQMCYGSKKNIFEYSLLETHKEWKGFWFYMENHNPTLKVASGFSPVIRVDRVQPLV